MAKAFRLTLVAVAVLTTAWTAPAVAGTARPSLGTEWVTDFLRSRLRLEDGDLARLARGEAVVRMVHPSGDREIAALGVAALPGRPARWTHDFEEIERLRTTSPDVLAIGRLGSPASAQDLAPVELDRKALPQIRKCRREECALNLSSEGIERLRRETDWAAADAAASASAVFRRVLGETAVRYQEKGDPSLPVFESRRQPLSTADVPPVLLARSPSLAQIAPSLEQHFRDPLPASDDVLFWVREKMWKHEVVSLVHAAFGEELIESGRVFVLVEKTFYANHYFRGVLAVTGLLEDPAGSYVFYINRSETDNGSGFNFVERALAGYLIPRRMSRQLAALRDLLSTQRAASTTP